MTTNNVRNFANIILTTLLLSIAAAASAQQRFTREEYILKHKHLAAETMERYGIPASVVMAQALLESDNGNSRLARLASNHFGIKCGGNWSGETIGHDDDSRGECFRAYADVEASFLDHGRFLDASSRYDRLFELPEGDYKAWAHGLRECGYATNPNYGPMLIKIIEDNRLYLLDDYEHVEAVAYADIRSEAAVEPGSKPQAAAPEPVFAGDETVVMLDRTSGRELRYVGETLFVSALPGDTLQGLARHYGVRLKKLARLNSLPEERTLSGGEWIRIQ